MTPLIYTVYYALITINNKVQRCDFFWIILCKKMLYLLYLISFHIVSCYYYYLTKQSTGKIQTSNFQKGTDLHSSEVPISGRKVYFLGIRVLNLDITRKATLPQAFLNKEAVFLSTRLIM